MIERNPSAPWAREITHSTPSVAAQLTALSTLPIKELWTLWDRYFPRRPSHHNRSHLEARIAYKLQEAAFGGLPTPLRTQLLRLGEAQSAMKSRTTNAVCIVPGTWLVREFGQREHRVLALPDGAFDYEGRRFKSLSAVARHITGTPWSGPVFFGLVPRKRKSP